MFPRQVPGLAFIRFQPVFGSFKIQNSNFFSSSSSFQFLKNNIVPQAESLRRLCSESLKEGTSLTKFNIPIGIFFFSSIQFLYIYMNGFIL